MTQEDDEYSRNLLLFALVENEFQRTGDIVQGLMPLFAPIAQAHKGQRFDIKGFSDQVSKMYGIELHPYVVENWVSRLAEAGFLQIVGDSESEEYIEAYYSNDFDADSIFERASFDRLLEPFVAHIIARLSEHGISLSGAEAEEAIYSRLIRPTFRSLLDREEKEFLPPRTLSLDKGRYEPDQNDLPANLDFLVAEYLLSLAKSNSTDFDEFVKISNGALVAEIVVGLQSPPSISPERIKLEIFLDAPVMMDLLDLGNREEGEYVRDLLAKAVEVGIKVSTFRHNIEELLNVFKALIKARDEGAPLRHSVGRRLQTDRYAWPRLRMVMKNIETSLNTHNVNVVSFADEYDHLIKYFDQEHETELLSMIRPFTEGSFAAREFDAHSLANIMRFVLSEPKMANLFSARAVFLTKNDGVAMAAQQYVESTGFIDEQRAPLCVTDRYFAGLLWLATGGKGEEIPKRKLIANCYAAVAPRVDVITRMLSFLDGLSDSQKNEFEVLIRDERCSYYLTHNTLGSAALLTEKNFERILEDMKSGLTEKHKTQSLKEKQLLEEKHSQVLGEVTSERDSLADKVADLNARNNAQRYELEKARLRRVKHWMRRANRAAMLAAIKIYGKLAAVFYVFTVVVLLTFEVNEFSAITQSILIAPLTLIFGGVQFYLAPQYFFGRQISELRKEIVVGMANDESANDLLNLVTFDWANGTFHIETETQT